MIDYRDNARWTVYIHIVPKEISGYDHDKYYCGITTQKPQNRWKSDGSGYKNQLFGRAIKKYRWKNILHEVIASNLTEEEAKCMEKTLIKHLQSNNPVYGYNANAGGDGMTGRKHTEEEKELMKKNHIDVNGANNPRHREIYQFTLYGIFVNKYDTITYAEKTTGIDHSFISRVARGKQKSAKGYIWRYENDVKESEENPGSFLLL